MYIGLRKVKTSPLYVPANPGRGRKRIFSADLLRDLETTLATTMHGTSELGRRFGCSNQTICNAAKRLRINLIKRRKEIIKMRARMKREARTERFFKTAPWWYRAVLDQCTQRDMTYAPLFLSRNNWFGTGLSTDETSGSPSRRHIYINGRFVSICFSQKTYRNSKKAHMTYAKFERPVFGETFIVIKKLNDAEPIFFIIPACRIIGRYFYISAEEYVRKQGKPYLRVKSRYWGYKDAWHLLTGSFA